MLWGDIVFVMTNVTVLGGREIQAAEANMTDKIQLKEKTVLFI